MQWQGSDLAQPATQNKESTPVKRNRKNSPERFMELKNADAPGLIKQSNKTVRKYFPHHSFPFFLGLDGTRCW